MATKNSSSNGNTSPTVEEAQTEPNKKFFLVSAAAFLFVVVLTLITFSTAWATVTPAAGNFGTITTGSTSAPKTFTYTSPYSYTISLAPVVLSDTTNFTKTSDGCSSQQIAAFGTCTVSVTFNPVNATPSSKNATLTFQPINSCFGAVSFYCPPLASESAALTGTAQAPIIIVPTATPVPPTATPVPPTATPVPPTPTSTPIPKPVIAPVQATKDNAIGGTVFLDGVPAPGFLVQLDPQNIQQTTGPDGRYNFTGLGAGFYVVRVVHYESALVMPVGQDYSDQPVSGTVVITDKNFQFVSKKSTANTPVAAIATPTTAVATAAATASTTKFNPKLTINPAGGPAGTQVQVTGTGWNPVGPNGLPNQVSVVLDTQAAASGAISGFSLNATSNRLAPIATLGVYAVKADGTLSGSAVLPVNLQPGTLFLVGNDLNQQKANTNFVVQPVAQVQPECPNVSSGKGLRVATKTVARNSRDFYLCIQVVAGEDGVNLNDTVILNLPQGATASEPRAGLGTVNITSNSVRWGGFSLAARQSTTLILSVSTLNGNLDNTSLFVSGRFNRGQSFQQRIPGLPELTEINVAVATPAPPINTGGRGGGSAPVAPAPVVPEAAPSTGVGHSAPVNETSTLLILAVLMGGWALMFSLLLVWRNRNLRKRS